MARVVVIGAGVGGLAAAARLAAQGHRVAVHERAATHGGKLGEYRRDGFTFDTGPSLLTLPQVFTDLFAATGGPADLELEPVDPVCGYRFADGTRLDLPYDPAAVPAALDAALGPGSGAAWQALHDRSARLWDLVGEPVLHRPLRARDLARFSARLRDLRVVAPWLTLRRLGEQLLPDPRLRMWLDRYATYSGSDPRRAPSVLSVTPYVEQRFGAWWVRGGLRRLGDALLERCHDARRRGAPGLARSPRSRRPAAGCRGSGSPTAGACPRTSWSPTPTPASSTSSCCLGPALRAAAARAALRRAPASVAGFVLLLALDGRRDGTGARPAHRVWFPPDYDAEFDALFRRPAPGARPDRLRARARPTRRWRRPAARRGSCWSTPRRTTRPAGSTGTRRACGSATPTGCWRCWRAAARTCATGSAGGRSAPRPTSSATPPRPAGRSTAPRRTGRWAALLRPANRSPVPGLYLVGGLGAPGRRAADRRACRRRSSPTSSGPA